MTTSRARYDQGTEDREMAFYGNGRTATARRVVARPGLYEKMRDEAERVRREEVAALLGSPMQDGCLSTCPHHAPSVADKARDGVATFITSIAMLSVTGFAMMLIGLIGYAIWTSVIG